MKLWKVPDSVLLHHRQTSFPTAPEGGHMTAFVNALAPRPAPPLSPKDASDTPALAQVILLLKAQDLMHRSHKLDMQ